jgi:leucyl-tRNA synthetase
MSKSLKNVINPDEIIEQYGADSMRLYEMFMGPLRQSKPWSTQGLIGIHRFLDRIWRLSEREVSNTPAPTSLKKVLHKTIKKVGQDTENLDFNTAISQMMIFINEAFKEESLHLEVWEPFILVLAPYAPHLAEELWEQLGHNKSLAYENFPPFEEELTHDDQVTLVLQVNGKVRAKVDIPAGIQKSQLEDLALQNERIIEYTQGKQIVKIISVPDKLVNIVVK